MLEAAAVEMLLLLLLLLLPVVGLLVLRPPAHCGLAQTLCSRMSCSSAAGCGPAVRACSCPHFGGRGRGMCARVFLALLRRCRHLRLSCGSVFTDSLLAL